MPEISRFLGLVIAIYYRDHNPPHFHARYGEHEVVVDINSGIVHGRFPNGHWVTSWNGMLYTDRNYWRTGIWPNRGDL
jgi:hypothetical protein